MDLPEEFGPFAIGEIVVLTIECQCLRLQAGDEVTINGPYTMHKNCRTGDVRRTLFGWLLLERAIYQNPGMKIIAQHGEVRRKKPRTIQLPGAMTREEAGHKMRFLTAKWERET